MIPLPKDFDAARARAALRGALATLEPARVEPLLAAVQAPVYEKLLSVAPPTVPASEWFDFAGLAAAVEAGDPTAFDVQLDLVTQALPAEGSVKLARELLECRPWKRLRGRCFEALLASRTEEGFRALLAARSAGPYIRRADLPSGPGLALARLEASPLLPASAQIRSRAELAQLPEAERSRILALIEAAADEADPEERVLVEDLISYVVDKGNGVGLARWVLASHPVEELRTRAAVALLERAAPEDLEFLARYLDDGQALVRSAAIRATLSLGAETAWDRLGGDALRDASRATDASELLHELGRDLAGTGREPVRGWALRDPRFAELAKQWLPDRKVNPNAELLLAGLAKTA